MAFLSNTAEGGANLTVVTLANSDDNSAGDALGVVSGSPTYSSTWANNGTTSFKCEATSGNSSLAGWTFTDTMVSFRSYFRFPAAPSATCEIVQVRNAANGGAIQLRTDRKLAVANDAASVVFTAAAALTVDTTYRLEISWERGTTISNGKIYFSYFVGESASAVESFSSTAADCGTADWTGVRWGKLTAIASTETYYFDTVAAETGTVSLLGPHAGLSSLVYSTARKLTVDCTGSVGALACTQTTGTTASIAGPVSNVFTITVPNHKDVLVFEASADGDGDAVTGTFKIYPDSLSNVLVLKAGGVATVLADWE